MAGSRTVTILAAMLRDASFFVGLLPVRAFLPAIVNVFVARLASFRSGILRGFGWRGASDGRVSRLFTLIGSLLSLACGGGKPEKTSAQDYKQRSRGPGICGH